MTIKTAILLEWLHLFCPTGARNRFWWTAHLLLCANIVFYCAAILALHLSCAPHARLWDKTVPGRCVDTRPLDIASAFVNFVVDVGILMLPQRVIWRLRMSTRKRMGVSAVFGLGIVYVLFSFLPLVKCVRSLSDMAVIQHGMVINTKSSTKTASSSSPGPALYSP